MIRVLSLTGILLVALLPTPAQDKKKPEPKKEPRVIFTLPIGVAPGKSKLILRGHHLDDAKEVRTDHGSVKLVKTAKASVPDKNPDKVGDTQIEIELRLEPGFAKDAIELIVVTPLGDTKPHRVPVETKPQVTAEKEANDGFRTAQSITLPAIIDGSINRPRDVDVFQFTGTKGQKVQIEALASRHGGPLDAILTLYDAKGNQLATNDDFDKDHRDARIELTLPADGIYYLSLVDAHDTGSALHVYRLVVK